MKNHIKSMRGVTLIEIAIVLVIIGLLLGGILKGQELINNAKVRALTEQQRGMIVAWNGFQDRFQAIPGDYIRAERYLPGVTNGNGDGLITELESVFVFNHVTAAGYLRCANCTQTDRTKTEIAVTDTLVNSYGGIMGIFHDTGYYMTETAPSGSGLLLSHTGSLIPSNILAEVDLKLDDDVADGGDFRYNDWRGTVSATLGNAPGAVLCFTDILDTTVDPAAPASGDNPFTTGRTQGNFIWRSATLSPPSTPNCGASFELL